MTCRKSRFLLNVTHNVHITECIWTPKVTRVWEETNRIVWFWPQETNETQSSFWHSQRINRNGLKSMYRAGTKQRPIWSTLHLILKTDIANLTLECCWIFVSSSVYSRRQPTCGGSTLNPVNTDGLVFATLYKFHCDIFFLFSSLTLWTKTAFF